MTCKTKTIKSFKKFRQNIPKDIDYPYFQRSQWMPYWFIKMYKYNFYKGKQT